MLILRWKRVEEFVAIFKSASRCDERQDFRAGWGDSYTQEGLYDIQSCLKLIWWGMLEMFSVLNMEILNL